MANIASAKKRDRRTLRRTAVNRARIGRVRSFIKKVEAAIAAQDRAGAEAALRAAEPEMMRGVGKGVFEQNTMSRKLSRLSRRVQTL